VRRRNHAGLKRSASTASVPKATIDATRSASDGDEVADAWDTRMGRRGDGEAGFAAVAV
jgi:hypothetical protein